MDTSSHARRPSLIVHISHIAPSRRKAALDDRDDAHVPPGLRKEHIDDLLGEAPDDVRFHISRGAGASFADTLPLLHPDGYLRGAGLFVSDMDDYRKGFRGPGKLDGSLVTWVNGALLRSVGARAGYDVHFAPFPYRPGTGPRFSTPPNARELST